SYVLVSMPPSLLESEYPSITSWQRPQESRSCGYSGARQTFSITSAARRSASMDSNRGTGISPGSPSVPAILTPDSAANRMTAKTSFSDSALLMMKWRTASGGYTFFNCATVRNVSNSSSVSPDRLGGSSTADPALDTAVFISC